MCLSVPAKVESITGDRAAVSVAGVTYNASLMLVENVKVGDYILLHSGYAIETLNEQEAKETLRYLEEAALKMEETNE